MKPVVPIFSPTIKALVRRKSCALAVCAVRVSLGMLMICAATLTLCIRQANAAPPGSVVYVASGGGQGLDVTGKVSDLTKPFHLQGTFPGGQSDQTFTPTGTNGGTSTYVMSGSGVAGRGRGNYTLVREGLGWVLTDVSYGCVDGIPNSCRSTKAVIQLKPE